MPANPDFFAKDTDIKKVLYHILRDGAEKEEEIEVKTDEDFILEKNKILSELKSKVDADFDKRQVIETKLSEQRVSKLKNTARLKLLEEKQNLVSSILVEVKKRINKSPNRKNTMELLLLEGTYKLLEPKIYVQVRPSDVDEARNAFPNVARKYEAKTQKKVTLEMFSKNLPSSCIGGAILRSPDGTVSLNNLFEERVNTVFVYNMPDLVSSLFSDKPRTYASTIVTKKKSTSVEAEGE